MTIKKTVSISFLSIILGTISLSSALQAGPCADFGNAALALNEGVVSDIQKNLKAQTPRNVQSLQGKQIYAAKATKQYIDCLESHHSK